MSLWWPSIIIKNKKSVILVQLPSLLDLRGEPDLHGNPLRVTEAGIADDIAGAASLVMGQAAQGIPAVLVKGLALRGPHNNASALIRDPDKDLFR